MQQRTAAALTTETTAAERTSKRPADQTIAAAASEPPVAAGAPAAASKIDEATTERTPRLDTAAQPAPAPEAEASSSVDDVAVIEAAAVVEPDPVVETVDVEQPDDSSPSDSIGMATAAALATAAAAEAALASPSVDATSTDDATTTDDATSTEDATSTDDAAAAAEPPRDEAAPVETAPTLDDAVAVDAAPPADEASASAAQAVAVIAAPKQTPPRKKRTLRVARAAPAAGAPTVLSIAGLVKRFGENTAVDGISLDVRAGSFYGIVGPNGAGKTTTLSMVTGLLRPDAGTVGINGIDAGADPGAAKRATGVLPDRLRLFDRLTGAQLLYYSGMLRGLDARTVRERSTDLIAAFGLEDAVDRLVADYSAGMTKKIALACAMIHSPRLLVLDEPFESVDPVSAANLTEILERYVAGGGTVVLSSHGMDLIERVCDSAAIIVGGRVLASGTLDEVRAGQTLEDRFVELAGGRKAAEGMEWLHSFSD